MLEKENGYKNMAELKLTDELEKKHQGTIQ